MEKNLIKKFYKTNGYFIYRINKKEIINLRKEFVSIFNLISKGNIRKKIKNDSDIIKLYKSKKINEMEKILFCASLFDLSSNFSNDKSYEKYRYLNSFLDRVLNKNYEYFPPFNLIKKDKIIYKL